MPSSGCRDPLRRRRIGHRCESHGRVGYITPFETLRSSDPVPVTDGRRYFHYAW
jgi:hypothetical protein